jgi:hypothetical protein
MGKRDKSTVLMSAVVRGHGFIIAKRLPIRWGRLRIFLYSCPGRMTNIGVIQNK